MTHLRDTGSMHQSPRCGAKTRRGTACLAPAVSGKTRCRMHGGAKGSGAPKGNQNALKHGHFTRVAQQKRQSLKGIVADAEAVLKKLE